jgi:hypothetical protein
MSNADQYIFPFGAAQQELLAQINMLRDAETELSPARQDRVIELLERLVLLGNDLSERGGRVQIRAQVIALAARIKTRSSYSDRSVRDWCKWAVELGVLSVTVRSHVYGRREWNLYTIDVERIRQLVSGETISGNLTDEKCFGMAGSGRKWPEVTAAPRAEVTAAPRAEVTAAPSNSSSNRRNNSNPATKPKSVVVVSLKNCLEAPERTTPEPQAQPTATNRASEHSRRGLELAIGDCGVARAREALQRATDAGLSLEDVRSRITRFRSLPDDEQIAGKLYNWLTLPRSYDSAQLGLAALPLALAHGLPAAAERRRADLIRHGRRNGWPRDQLQAAIVRFEQEQLSEATAER